MSKGTEEFKTVLESFLHSYLIDRDGDKARAFLSPNLKRIGTEKDDNSECEKNSEQILWESHRNNISIRQIKIHHMQVITSSENCADAIGNVEMLGLTLDDKSFTIIVRINVSYSFQDGRWFISDLQMSAYYDYLKDSAPFFSKAKLQMEEMIDSRTFNLLSDMIVGGTLVTGYDGQRTILLTGDNLVQYLGYTIAEFDQASKGSYNNLIDPRDLDFVNNSIHFQLQNENQYEVEYRLIRKDHTSVWVQEKGYFQKGGRKGQDSLFGVICDNAYYAKVEERRLAKKATIVADLSDCQIVIHDCAFHTEPDYSRLQFPVEINEVLRESFLQCLENKSDVKTEFRCSRNNKDPEWYCIENIPLLDDKENVRTVFGKITNINEKKKIQIYSHTSSEQDDLTGLYTKSQLRYLVEQEMINAYKNEFVAFLLLGTDRFQIINERLGFIFGNTLLRNIASLLQSYTLKYQGYAGRIGGDRFAIFLKTASLGEISNIADNICRDIRGLYVGELPDVQLTCSIGIVDCVKWCKNFDDMFVKASQALYRSKNMGKNMILFYNGQPVGSEQEQAFIHACTMKPLYRTEESAQRRELWEWVTGLLSTTKDFDSAVKLLLFCLRRYFKLSCLYIKEVFPDSKYAKISYLMHNGNFDDDLTCHELYAYGNDRSDDPIPEQKYCKLTADFNSDSYRKLLNEFNGGKTDIAAEYSIVNGNEIIGSIAAVREKSEAFWSRTETETLQKLTEIISPYILKKQYAGKFVHKYEGLNSEIVGVCSLSLFLERVARFLQDNPESTFAIVYSNLGNYSEIIERHGFMAGKEALQTFADLLRTGTTNRRLCVAHISDDRFTSVLSVTDLEMLKDYISRNNNRIVKVFREKYSDINIYVNTGICEIQRIEDGILKAIQNADVARKSAKGQMKNTCRLFDDQLKMQLSRERKMVDDLELALKQGEFAILLQPIFHISDGEMVGAEAVVHWKRGDRFVYPDEFVPILEKHGLMVKVDLFVMKHVLKTLQHWLKSHKRMIPVSIKLSRDEALDPNRAAFICALCKQYGVPLSYLEFSFSEKDFGNNPVPLRQLMNKLMKRGFHVSVDRFGFGESPLKHIISFPANSIKLSDEFLGYNNRVLYTNTIVKHFVSMMKEMGFGITCGGVKTQEQLELLQNVGCEQAQGSYYAEPMTIEQFEFRYLD